MRVHQVDVLRRVRRGSGPDAWGVALRGIDAELQGEGERVLVGARVDFILPHGNRDVVRAGDRVRFELEGKGVLAQVVSVRQVRGGGADVLRLRLVEPGHQPSAKVGRILADWNALSRASIKGIFGKQHP